MVWAACLLGADAEKEGSGNFSILRVGGAGRGMLGRGGGRDSVGRVEITLHLVAQDGRALAHLSATMAAGSVGNAYNFPTPLHTCHLL